MLKLSVGYQYSEDFCFSQIVRDYADSIEEVYFPWVDSASGRSVIGGFDGYFDYGLQNILIEELKRIKSMGIKLDLLFNANCYGDQAMSKELQGKVYSIIDYLTDCGVGPDVITTTSPAIAHMVKEQYENIELKASVNMRISTVKGMQYVAHLFDSYCIAKECNRNIEQLKILKEWANENNKKITMLANSGCMRDCSGQTFHDNMVAHEAQISQRNNIKFLPYMCWNYLKDEKNFVSVLQNTWIRPEDIHNYEGLVDTVKLATRAHHLLFEPGFSPAFAPYVIDSSKIPDDFWKQTTSCDKNCSKCNYCSNVLKYALVID